jgi:hypothetical protein
LEILLAPDGSDKLSKRRNDEVVGEVVDSRKWFEKVLFPVEFIPHTKWYKFIMHYA